MKKYLIAFLLLFPIKVNAAFTSTQIDAFGGLVNVLEADSIADKYSPDLLNVFTDEYNAITKRQGYSTYLTSALTDLQQVRTLYPYSKQDGNKYLIIESSSSLYYSSGDGAVTSIISGRNPNYRYSFMTIKDYLQGSNGSNNVFYSSATNYTEYTIANSTGMVKARYICNYYNKAFYAGVDGARATIYWSKYLDPANIQPFSYLNINAQDGDVITGMRVTSDNKLKIWKTYSTWEIYPTGVDSSGETNFDFRNLSQDIGCIYGSTIDELNNVPIWLGARGVYLYDGTFNLISAPIDNYVKNLRQMHIGQSILTQDTASDWGAGTGVNIDTTTYSGSVACSLVFSSSTNQQNNVNSLYTDTSASSQSFRTSVTGNIVEIDINFGASSFPIIDPGSDGNMYLDIYSSTFGVIATAINTSYIDVYTQDYYSWQSFYVTPSTSLTAESTYYFKLRSGAFYGSSFNVKYSTGNQYNRGNWGSSSDNDALFIVYISTDYASTSSYTTQILNAGSSCTAWLNFSANTTLNGGAIDYYAVTSTSAYNLTTNTYFKLNNNAPIPSSVFPYMLVVSSLTKASQSTTPLLHGIAITYIETNNEIPVGKVYDGRYHLFVSTDNATKINNVDLVYQKTGEWTIFNDIYTSGACIYRDYFYTGDSRNTGQVYKMFVKDLYNDNGGAYDAYWCSKVFDFGAFANEKKFDSMWVSAKNSGNWNLSIDYRLDGTINSWTNKSINLYNSYGDIIVKVPFAFDQPNTGRLIQYRIGNSNANECFTLKRLQTVYEVLPPQ